MCVGGGGRGGGGGWGWMCCVLLHEWQGWRGELVAGNGAGGGGARVGIGVQVLVAVVLALEVMLVPVFRSWLPSLRRIL